MLARGALLFVSQLPSESRRIDLTVIRVLYASFALSLMMPVSELDPIIAGGSLLRAMTVVHAALAILLGIRLSGDVAGIRASGAIGLLALSGIPAREVIGSQLLLAVISFLSVWLIRVPVLFLIFHLGGITLHQILQIEVLLVGLFGMTLCAGLLLAHYSPDRTISRLAFLVPLTVELAAVAPSMILSSLQSWLSISVPSSIENVSNGLRCFGVSYSLYYTSRSLSPSPVYLMPLTVQIGVAALSLWVWTSNYFISLDEADVPPSTVSHSTPRRSSHSMSRPSRPVWDDALAWQAFHVHGMGRFGVMLRSILAAACFVLVVGAGLSSLPDVWDQANVILYFIALGLMFLNSAKVGDCLQREIKASTFSVLALTPHTPLELCDGWRRGVVKLMRADLFLLGFTFACVICYSLTEGAPLVVDLAILALACGPLFILSPLVPWSFQGIFSGLGLVVTLLIMLMIVVVISAIMDPWLGTAVAIPLAWIWKAMGRRMVPVWIAQKQDDLV